MKANRAEHIGAGVWKLYTKDGYEFGCLHGEKNNYVLRCHSVCKGGTETLNVLFRTVLLIHGLIG